MLATKKKAQLIANKFMERHQQGTPYLTKMVRQAFLDQEVLRLFLVQDEAYSTTADDLTNLREMAEKFIEARTYVGFFD